MQLTETARVRLLIDGKEAVSELTMLEKKFDDANEAKKKFARSSNEFKELNAESKELAKSIALVRERMDVANMTTKEAARYQKDLILAFKDLKKGTEDYALASKKLTEVNTHLASLRRDMNAVNTEVVKQKSTWDNLRGWIVGAFTVVAIQEFGRRLIDLGMGVFDITAKFERYEAVLGNATGTTALATKAMADIKNMAATTPFTVDELTDSYVKFANRGLMPTQKEMKAMADVAATTGKSFEQLSEALLDGAMGQLKRFTELGISAEKMGDKIKLSFKGVSTTVSMDLEGMNAAMLYFQQNAKGVAGATDVIAKTMEGRVSNLKDLWDFARIELGNKIKPLFEDIIDGLYGMVDGVKFLVQNFERFTEIAKNLTVAGLAYVGAQKLIYYWTEREILISKTKEALDRVRLVLQGQKIIALQSEATSMNVLTAAETRAVAAANTFNASLQKNAIVLAFTVALYGLYEIYQSYTEAVEIANSMSLNYIKLNDQAIIGEKTKGVELGLNIERVKGLALGTKERKEEVEKLMKVFPEYFKNLTAEQVSNWHLDQVYRGVNAQIERKIDLMAKEQRVKNTTDRLVKLKLDLDSSGVGTNLADYNKKLNEQLFVNPVAADRARKDIQEYNKLLVDMQKYQNDYGQANIKQFNEAARIAQERLKAGRITVDQFKSEITLLQNKHQIFVQNYEDENKNLNAANAAAAAASSKKGKIKDEELKRDEARFDELFEMQKDQVKRVKELEQEYWKWAEEFRKFRNKQINDAIDIIQKNFEKKDIADNKAHEDSLAAGKKKLSDRIIKTNQDTIDAQDEANEAFVKKTVNSLEYQSQALARWYSKLSNVQKQALDAGIGMIADFLGKQGQQIEDQINKTTDLYEKARLETKKQWIEVGQDALNTFDQMLNGNVVGSVIGVFKTLAGALDNWLMSNAREERARLEQEIVLLKKAGEEFMESTKSLFTAEDVSNINAVYGTLIKMSEVTPVRYDLGEYDNYERRLQQELAIGASVVANYNTAIDKENDLYDKAKANEEQLLKDAIDKINKQYEAAVEGINKKYDWEQQMANRTFDLQSLGIQKQTNAELMALLTNNDTKLSITSEFESKKAAIMAAFASQIKPITADMSQAEIDGINRATEARDAQLAKLEGWLTNELTFVINNEGQKRKEYTATEKIIEDGKNKLNDLAIKHAADDIQRDTDRKIALETAEAKKITDTEAAEKKHLDNMAGLAKSYNDTVTALGLAKDAALAESFMILNDIVKNGYDDMIAKALEAFNAGKITAEQYDEIASRLFNIKNMLGQIDWSKLTVPNFEFPNYDFKVPGFGDGGIMKASDYFENHGVLGGLSHNTPEGGNWVVNARTGRIQAKVEAGEWMGIVNKKTTARYKNLLSYLANSSVATTGKPVYAENGYFGTPTPVDGSAKSFTSTTTNVPVFEGFGELVGLMREFIAKVEMSNELLGAVAVSSDETAKKSLVISVNNILEAADIVADVDRRSSFS